MAFDFKKEFKEFYFPKNSPEIVHVPKMNFVAVRGKGNPNEKNGEYQRAIKILYAISYTIKMSKKGDLKIMGYFDFVVPPLEGFWWQEQNGISVKGFDYSNKNSLNWISAIRLPDFVSEIDFEWAKEKAANKEKIDCSSAEFFMLEEGDCVQIMHTGSYDDEPSTVKMIDNYATENGWKLDISDKRFHHEIYLGDPRKTVPEKLRTVIRHPVKN